MDEAVRPSGGAPGTVRTPVRTCVGCRRRDGQAALLRVVAVRTSTSPSRDWMVVPDERRVHAGRGAYVHPAPECLRLAIRRQAFGRALREDGRPDTGPLEEWVAQQA